MKRVVVGILLGLALAGWGALSRLPNGAPAASASPPQRIVSLAPSLTEILFALGLGNRVVGVTDFCDYPEAARRRPKVGGYVTPSLEAIVGLKPQLVVAVPDVTNRALLERLSQLEIQVLRHEARGLPDIWSTIEAIGRTTGTQPQAQRLVAEMRERMERVREQTRRAPQVRVLFVFAYDPLVVAGGGTFFDELIRLAGGTNVAGDSRVRYPKYSLEEVLRRDPQVILLPGRHGVSADLLPAQDSAQPWQRWPGISAVRQGRIYTVNDTALIRPGPRLIQGLELLARLLHPELWGQGRRKDP
ncbi:MAG: cobalamin-binding protein [Candidatus Tectomicrobia bacterium]|uniref:Cobalamin-binding protein n=1 Tax=Tectimicrobiota bacterium TaxID=2528274 RepID=A0A932FZM2_UNCTE|nr:cobalamin-binding protein [Candidatus Tectomicrobia bacterium]